MTCCFHDTYARIFHIRLKMWMNFPVERCLVLAAMQRKFSEFYKEIGHCWTCFCQVVFEGWKSSRRAIIAIDDIVFQTESCQTIPWQGKKKTETDWLSLNHRAVNYRAISCWTEYYKTVSNAIIGLLQQLVAWRAFQDFDTCNAWCFQKWMNISK